MVDIMKTTMNNEFDPVNLGILWDRLISITDEILVALVRTSFSTNVRESYDLSCVLFDSNGSSLAQGTYSLPSFTGTAPATIKHMLQKFPSNTLQSGDVIVTNDPWLGTGHLFDINVMRPVFRGHHLVGYTLSIAHLPDIGGRGFSTSAADKYEEGLHLPVCKLVKAGSLNEELVELIRSNVRVSELVVGDLMANVTCNEVGGRLLVEFMDEYGIDDLVPLSHTIIGQSEKALRDKISEIPDGVYENAIQVSAIDDAVTLACRIEIAGDKVHINFDGTDPAIRGGVNVPFCYTKAFAVYAIKCLTTPKIPNNEGSVRPIAITAPQGCILNAKSPSPTAGRHSMGHFVVPLIFGALVDVMPEKVPADSGMFSLMSFQGIHRDGKGVSSICYVSGGLGALDGLDGASAVPAPSNMTGTQIEVWEDLTGMIVDKKAILADSGGAGMYRGGLGQEIVLINDTKHPMMVSFFGQRTQFPSLGVQGGKAGQLRAYWINGKDAHPKGNYVLNPGDQVRAVEAGGGGYGDPRKRPGEKLLDDVRNGYVTLKGAQRDYGVKLDPGSTDAWESL